MNALTGQPDADGPSAAEGRRLRAAVLTACAAEATAVRPDASRADAFIARLRRERLLEPPRPAPRVQWPWLWGFGATAAALFGWWFVVPASLPYPELPSYRGEIGERSAKVGDPRAAAEQLVGALRERGVPASIFAAGGSVLVDMDVTDANREPIAAELARWAPGAETPTLAAGTLRLRLEKR